MPHSKSDKNQTKYSYRKIDDFNQVLPEKSASSSHIAQNRALNEIIAAKSSSYRIIYDSLSLNQKKALKILALEGEKIYSKEIMLAFNTKKEGIVSALKQLFKKELVDRENGQWFIPDRALEIWCSRL